jgi:hypothetical protein
MSKIRLLRQQEREERMGATYEQGNKAINKQSWAPLNLLTWMLR